MASAEAPKHNNVLLPETETQSTLSVSSGTLTRRRSSNVSDVSQGRATSLYPTASRASTASGYLNFINTGTKTPISPGKSEKNRLLSLFRLLILELNLPKSGHSKQKDLKHEEEQEQAYEQLVSMVKVPVYLEKFIVFGLLMCLNSFLTLFTLVPLKIAIITYTAFADFGRHFSQKGKADYSLLTTKLHFVKRDVINVFIIVATVALLSSPRVEISRLYHDVRGQAHLKLYVIFGVLEAMDKLLSSIGQEIFTVLVGIPVTNTDRRSMAKLALFVFIALIYSASHSYVLIYQSVSLHVAANSYSNALMALLVSNQFAELKGAVFKKFDREGLFQVAMSDLTERFQLSLMLFIISVRNIAQLNMTQLGLVVPDSWKSWNKWFGAVLGPSLVVLGSEIFVDWLKHCFIIKFNRIKPRVYENFLYVTSTDYMEVFTSNSKRSTSKEVSDYIILTKRIGLPMLSLAICFLRMLLSDLKQLFVPTLSISSILACGLFATLTFITLVVVRLVLGLWLLKWARRIKLNHEAYQTQLTATALANYPVSEESAISSVNEDFSREFTPETDRHVIEKSLDFKGQPASLDPLDTSFTKSTSPINLSPSSPQDKMPFSVYPLDTQSEIEQSFFPGNPNTEKSSINPRTRALLYDYGEEVPPTGEERRNDMVRNRAKKASDYKASGEEILRNVHRYEMSSKRIW